MLLKPLIFGDMTPYIYLYIYICAYLGIDVGSPVHHLYGATVPSGPGPPIIEASRSHSDTPHLIRLSGKVILVGVIGIFQLLHLSGRTMTLESTQPLKEMSTSGISWGVKAASA
jgi:hypothetical protein